MTNDAPTLTQLRALAYAPKPFAFLSFCSSIFIIYYLTVRHPYKLKRMYHRLMLASFICFLPLSFALFVGTWAMPKDTPMAIGSVGSDATCAAQGFVILVFYLAFPFYYASISVFAYLAVKNNFNEEKYAWLEKWIHIGAYALPLSVSIASLAKGWYGPGLQFCNLEKNVGCDNYVECYDKGAFNIYEPLEYLILVELLVGTGTITVLLCKYEKMQREIDEAVGYTRIVETVRRRRLVEAAIQTGLYIFTFWFGYLPLVVESFIRNVSGKLTYDLIIASRCIFAFQGVLLMAIYLALSRINRSARISVARLGETTASCGETTVSKIRANAERKRRMSAHSSVSNRSAFKFSIFDGTPSDDSPWAQYFDDSERGGEISETSTTSDLSSRLISTGMLDEGEDWRS